MVAKCIYMNSKEIPLVFVPCLIRQLSLLPGPDYPLTGLGEFPGAPANRGAPSD